MEILPTGSGATLVTAVTGVIGDNIVEVLVILGAFVGMHIAARLINGAKKGKVRV